MCERVRARVIFLFTKRSLFCIIAQLELLINTGHAILITRAADAAAARRAGVVGAAAANRCFVRSRRADRRKSDLRESRASPETGYSKHTRRMRATKEWPGALNCTIHRAAVEPLETSDSVGATEKHL